jgi:protein TonB
MTTMNTNTLGLHPVYRPRDPSRRYKGIAVVIGLHVLLIGALVSGTAQDVMKITKKKMEAVVAVDLPPPPPPPPPPKVIKPPEAPKVEAPPPPFVPPPDIAPPVSNAPSIVSAPVPPPTPVVIAPPPPPPAPPAPVVNRSDIRVACPTQVAPEMPRKAAQDGTEGVVKASAVIRDGAVREVNIISGPRVFHAAVKAAMMQYKCSSGTGEITATQEFVFKLE